MGCARASPVKRGKVLLLLVAPVLAGCSDRSAPPGAAASATARERAVALSDVLGGSEVDAGPGGGEGATVSAKRRGEPGSLDDNLPFVPTGKKLASTAWRTWIYTDIGPNRTRYGYLRVGAIVDVREPSLVNDGCAEGWYRVNPRGFVCLGKGATLDLATPVVVQANVRPVRGQGYPYLYAMASDSPPHFYFQLPSPEQVRAVEGGDPRPRFERWKARFANNPAMVQLIGTPGEPPPFLTAGGRLEKPYGVEHRLENRVTSGRAAADSGFSLTRTMTHDGRWYGVTAEHDLLALDRVRVIVPTSVVGIEVPPSEGATAGFADHGSVARFRLDERGNLVAKGALSRRQAVALTGKRKDRTMMETAEGDYVAASGLRLIPVRHEFPSFATGDRKWIDISIGRQTLMAYVGRRPVYAALVSTGRGGMGDPETQFATPRGTFMIYAKHVAATMDGSEDVSDSYSLLDVPFVQYFHKGYALHGTYWHDDFGRVRSHGCVNLTPRDAAWLFEWTDPSVPVDWHGVINKERGTVVTIHG
jgi:lipoprotein-anchoring transpeptidase ErfK/SrfK